MILGAAALMLLAGCEPGQQDGQGGGRRGGFGRGGGERTIGVILGAVTVTQEETRIEAVGTARARASATLYPATGGEVVDVLFTAGDFVEQGSALVRLNDDEQKLAVRLAEVSVKEAEQLLARYRRIEDTGAVSDSQIDEAQTALEAARLRLDQAEVALRDRTIVAPFAGFLSLTDIDPGVRITPTTAIAQIDDRRVLFVDFAAPEQVFTRIKPGDAVGAVPFADPDQLYTAEVVKVDSRIDPDRRTFTVRAAVDNVDDVLRPGMSFQIAVTFPGPSYPTVPEAAILWGSDGSYLWAVEDGVVTQIPVGIVARRRGQVLVRGEIAEGAVIVAEGVQKVREGVKVRDINAERPERGRRPGQGEGGRPEGRGGR
ncbi:MAG: efflux RND transporter periplasmic adaptor subunit [Alphaproteobacteria bacterium]